MAATVSSVAAGGGGRGGERVRGGLIIAKTRSAWLLTVSGGVGGAGGLFT